MADLTKTTINYVSPEKLGYYDEKIKAYIKAKDDALQLNIDAANTAISNEETRAKAAELTNATAAAGAQAAAEAAQAAADKAQGEVDALETYVGTFESETATTVVEYIDAKTANIASDETVNALANRVKAIEDDYLVEEDKTELSNAVNAEKERAMGIEAGLEERLATVEGDYLKAADKTALEGKITEAQNAVQGAVDALEEAHGKDKEALEDAIDLKADKTALDEVSAVANAAATKEAFDAAVEALEKEDVRIEGLVTAEAAKAREEEGKLDARLVEVETFFKTAEGETLDEALDTLVELQKYLSDEGSVADQMLLDIAANKKAIEDHVATNHDFAAADTALKNELTGVINTKAAQADLEALDGRVETAESEIDTLQSEMDAVEGRMDIAEGKIEALEAKFTGEGSVDSKIEAAEQAAKDHADEKVNELATGAVADNTAAIAAINHEETGILTVAKKYADDEDAKIESRVGALETASATHALASDVTTLAGRVTTVEGKVTTLEGEMDAVEGAVATKAEAQALADEVTARTNADTALSDRIAVLEAVEHVAMTTEEIDALFA